MRLLRALIWRRRRAPGGSPASLVYETGVYDSGVYE